jgi:hypothetical protein
MRRIDPSPGSTSLSLGLATLSRKGRGKEEAELISRVLYRSIRPELASAGKSGRPAVIAS